MISFGSRKLKRALLKLGFCADSKNSGSRHVKYFINISIPGERPFITLIDNVKQYDPFEKQCGGWLHPDSHKPHG